MTEQSEIIGFMIEGDNLIVANPCTIPLELIENILKDKKPRKKNEVSHYVMIKLPTKLKKIIKGSKLNYKGEKKIQQKEEFKEYNCPQTKPKKFVETEREASQSYDGMKKDKTADNFNKKYYQKKKGEKCHREKDIITAD